jgi:mono/diheme cytochrome c family protein
VRRLWAALSLVAVVAALGVASGCVDSSEEAAQTPATAPTVPNTAAQTDSEGKTVTAPAAEGGGATAPPEEGGGGAAGGGGGGGEATGDAAAGQEVFTQRCQSCHLNGGQQAGVGPQLAGMGLDAEAIRNQVINGGGAMPPGLATGTDLDNVVAFVVSIQ